MLTNLSQNLVHIITVENIGQVYNKPFEIVLQQLNEPSILGIIYSPTKKFEQDDFLFIIKEKSESAISYIQDKDGIKEIKRGKINEIKPAIQESIQKYLQMSSSPIIITNERINIAKLAEELNESQNLIEMVLQNQDCMLIPVNPKKEISFSSQRGLDKYRKE